MKRPEFIEEMEFSALKATPGQWRTSNGYVWTGDMACLTHGHDSVMYNEDASHVALANPKNILELIHYVKVLERVLAKRCGYGERRLLIEEAARELAPSPDKESH